MNQGIEIPITVKAEANETFADKPQPKGSFTGVESLADDEIRIELGKKSHYPLCVADTQAFDLLSEEEKEKSAREWAGEKGAQARELGTRLGDHPQWKQTGIPYSPLEPELVSEQDKQKSR